MEPEDADLIARVGPLEVDWPRTAGYYGGVALAVALGMIEWPLALFLASIPLVKLLNRRDLPRRVRTVVQVFEGMAKPVGGDAEGTMQLTRTPPELREAAERAVGEAPRPTRASRRAAR
jgi:hypothetical protein